MVGCSITQQPDPTGAPPPPTAGPTEVAEQPTNKPNPTKEPTSPVAEPTTAPTEPAPTAPPEPPAAAANPVDLVSQDILFAFLEDLTAIRPYSGWRNSGSQGEQEALDYVQLALQNFSFLTEVGLELERQSFHVFLATDLWETRLHLTVGGQEIEVPADGLRGPRDHIGQALRFDSDGTLNDSDPNPVVTDGQVLVIRSADEIASLTANDVAGKIVFLDYAAVDRVLWNRGQAIATADELLSKGPAGLILVTEFSNEIGQSHGTFVGDLSALNWVESQPVTPILYARLEDLAQAGITGWDDLDQIETARMTWDADVFSPGTSGNLVARIPGVDSTRALIVSAHIDSPNAPGAMDDGSGSVVLLEVARVLNEAQYRPAHDLYLVWFGSEELGLYGAGHFANTHQELLDRAMALLQIDCLTRPLNGIEDVKLDLVAWSYGRLGNGDLTWPSYIQSSAAKHYLEVRLQDRFYMYSDNSMFNGYDLPNTDLIYQNEEAMGATGSLHYAGHLHDPYDTVELAREVGDVLEQMAQIVVAAVVDATSEAPSLRVAPPPQGRVVFVGSHTESIHMAPTGFTDMGMTMAMEGLDVDLIPYGQPVTLGELESADLVVVLPVLDYPSVDGDTDLYDDAWSAEEIAVLEGYAAGGGFLVLTNSANRLKYSNRIEDANEDWSDINALAEEFGVTFFESPLYGTQVQREEEHPLTSNAGSLEMAENNGVRFTITDGQVLATAGGEPAIALVSYGEAGGEVLVLADVGLLGNGWGEPQNMPFWRNLARYGLQR
jgi:hypothetical protein